MFSLPTNFVSEITTNATSAISALAPYTTLIIGVLLAVLVISVIVSTLSKHN
jgi:hypothetical protein